MCATFAAHAGESKKKKKKKKSKKKKVEQTEPPTIGLSKLFPDGKFPEGELQEYKNECAFLQFPCSYADENVSTLTLHVAMPSAQHPKRNGTTSRWLWRTPR